jgi:CubicO group peptidase (beta-lactamase class C family)
MKKFFTSILILFSFNIQTQAQTGLHVPELVAFDSAMTALLADHNVPGGQLALTYQGRLVYNRGFGYANTSNSSFVQPNSVFRIASISKPITSVAIMKLFEQGLLTLDAKVFGPTGILNDTMYQNILDSRVTDITVRHLLHHEGGWDRNISGDPMFNAYNIATFMSVPPPGDAVTMIKYMLANRLLDFTPGTQAQYSNFGYCVLGRVIEKITGESYENYMRGTIFVPMGITEIQLGRNLEADILPNEVTYYDYPGAPLANSVYDNTTQVPWPYAGFNVEFMDAHGGWVSSAEDLCKFLVSVDRFTTKPDILTTATIDTMIKPSTTDPNYACGFAVNAFNNWWHNGSLSGTSSEFVRAGNLQLNWAILLNTRPANSGPLMTDVDNLVWNCLSQISSWPSHDLFTAIDETEMGNFNMYPNPTSENVFITLNNPELKNSTIKLFDMIGQIVYSSEVVGDNIQINTSALENGIYCVQISNAGKRYNKKLIIQN